MIRDELSRVQTIQNLNASPMTVRSEMGFVQLLQLANQLINGGAVNLAASTNSLAMGTPQTEEVKHVTKIYLQLKYFMKEEKQVSHTAGTNCHKSSQKYS